MEKAYAVVSLNLGILFHTIRDNAEDSVKALEDNLVVYTTKQMFNEFGYKVLPVEISIALPKYSNNDIIIGLVESMAKRNKQA